MNKVNVYRGSNGKEPFTEYINGLKARDDKYSKLRLNKIDILIRLLEENGTQMGMPHVRHLTDMIWELRFLRNERILFAKLDDENYLILHHFVKDSEKTPLRELKKAKREVADVLKRGR